MTTIHATFARRGSRLTMLASTVLTLGMTAVQAQEVTLDFWDQIWGPPEYVETAQRLVDQWNAEHPDVQVVYRSVPWTGWYETYVTAIASGSAPDISTGAGFQAVQFYDVGEILPVDDVVAALGEDPFTPGALDAVTYDGHVVALPWNIDIRAIYYRRDLLEAAGIEPPTTWEEFRTAAKALTGEGVYGLVSGGDSAGLQWMPTLMLNNGGGLFDAEGKPSLTGERSMEALEFLGDLVADGSVDPSSVGYTQDDARGAFCRGEAAFILDAPDLEAQCGEAGDQVAVLSPIESPNGDTGTLFWVNNIMVYNQTEHPEETTAFLQWWSENQLPLWTEGHSGSLPARRAFLEDPYFQSQPNIAAIIDQYLPVAQPMSAQAGGTFPELNEIEGDGFLNTLVQKIWQGEPVAEAVVPAQEHLVELVE